MVTRTVIVGRVVGVEYTLTPLGRSLHAPLSARFDWTAEHLGETHEHQRRYDGRADRR